jgi:hypothetical protein
MSEWTRIPELQRKCPITSIKCFGQPWLPSGGITQSLITMMMMMIHELWNTRRLFATNTRNIHFYLPLSLSATKGGATKQLLLWKWKCHPVLCRHCCCSVEQIKFASHWNHRRIGGHNPQLLHMHCRMMQVRIDRSAFP